MIQPILPLVTDRDSLLGTQVTCAVRSRKRGSGSTTTSTNVQCKDSMSSLTHLWSLTRKRHNPVSSREPFLLSKREKGKIKPLELGSSRLKKDVLLSDCVYSLLILAVTSHPSVSLDSFTSSRTQVWGRRGKGSRHWDSFSEVDTHEGKEYVFYHFYFHGWCFTTSFLR